MIEEMTGITETIVSIGLLAAIAIAVAVKATAATAAPDPTRMMSTVMSTIAMAVKATAAPGPNPMRTSTAEASANGENKIAFIAAGTVANHAGAYIIYMSDETPSTHFFCWDLCWILMLNSLGRSVVIQLALRIRCQNFK